MTRCHRTALVTTIAFAIAAPAARSQPPSRSSTVGSAEVARTPQTTARESVTRRAVSATVSRERALEVLGGSQRLRVVRASGVTDVAPSATAVTVAPGEFLFRKLSDTARRVRASDVDAAVGRPDVHPDVMPSPRLPALPATAAMFAMPYRWMTVDSAGVERVLVPYFVLLGGGLTYDVESRMYRGQALIGVEDTLDRDAQRITLVRPLRMLLATTKGGRVSPAQVAIAHTSLDYDSVHIESPDSNVVRISTGADEAGIFVPIPVLGMTIAMTPQQRTLQGFGLATTEISVTLPRGMSRRDNAFVNFSSSGPSVRPDRVRVSGEEGATVRVRSGLPGADTIRAFIDGVEVGRTEVVSELPIAFLVATLCGIVLGGAARFVGGKRRKRVRSLPWDIVKGAPFGLLASMAGAVGLDLAQLKLDEPGALPALVVTAAIGAWLGAKLLDRGGGPVPAAARGSP